MLFVVGDNDGKSESDAEGDGNGALAKDEEK